MNKKAMQYELLIVLIIVVILAVGIISFSKVYMNLSKGTASKTAVQTWVRAGGFMLGEQGPGTSLKSLYSDEISRPPVPELADPYVIDKVSDLKANGDKPPQAYEEIANSMYDCWDAFERGQIDFLNKAHKQTFCYPCRVIKFSPEVRQVFPKIRNFNRYLNEYQPISGTNRETYLQYLANDKDYVLDEEDLKEDVIELPENKDLYVMFFAASGRTWGNIALTVLGLADAVPQDLTAANYIPTSASQGTESVERTGIGEDVTGLRSLAAGGTLGAGHLASKGILLYQQYKPGTYAATKTSADLAKALSRGAQLSVISSEGTANLGTAEEVLAKIKSKQSEVDALTKAATKSQGSAQIEAASKAVKAGEELKTLKQAETTAKAIKSGSVALKAEIEIAEEGSKKLALTFTEAGTEKKGAKAVGKLLGKGFVRLGVKALASKINLFATIGLGVYGAYEVTFGDKPFIATVMLTEPTEILKKCNEETPIKG